MLRFARRGARADEPDDAEHADDPAASAPSPALTY